MNEAEVFILAEKTFAKVVEQIKDEQWDMALPEWFELGRTQDRATLKLRDIINYHAYDTAWVPDTFSGKTTDEVGSKYDGDLLGDDPKASYKKYSDAAIKAIEQNYDPERKVHFTYGEFSSKEAITHPTSFRVFRSYDVAKLIGIDRALPVNLIEDFWKEVEQYVGWWREMGIFKPALPVPDNADPQAKLFALTGRDPDWQANR